MCIPVFFENGTAHSGLRIPLQEECLYLSNLFFYVLSLLGRFCPRVIIPVVALSVKLLENILHGLQLVRPPPGCVNELQIGVNLMYGFI